METGDENEPTCASVAPCAAGAHAALRGTRALCAGSRRSRAGHARLGARPGPAELIQPRVQLLDRPEDLLSDGLLLLATRRLHLLVAERLAVLDRHLRELQPLPVAALRGAVDRDRHDHRSGLQREPADPALGPVGQLAG